MTTEPTRPPGPTRRVASLSSADIGALGENLAADHLRAAGMALLERNWRAAAPELRGELDIVARDGDTLVICEVKARRGRDAGHPAEAVTPRKLAKLRALAGAWLAESGLRVPRVRFDVVTVCWPGPGAEPEIVHLRGVGAR